MAEETREGIERAPRSGAGRPLWEMLTTRRPVGALAAALAILALLMAVLYTRVLSILPGYPAVLIAFLVWSVAPGWLLQRAIFGTRATGLIERLVAAFLMSVALASAPGVLALRFHWSLETFAILYAVVASVVSGLSLLWRPEKEDRSVAEEPAEEPRGLLANAPLLLLVGVPLLAIGTSPFWSGDRIARDADDRVYTGYVNQYLHSKELDASEPFLDTRRGSFGRMQANVWVVMEALTAKTADVEAFELHMDYLPAVLTVFAVGSMFALAKGLFGSLRLALLAAALILVHAFLDLAPQEGYGRMLLLRMAQDKMVASFILVPVGLLLGARYLSKPSAAGYLAVLLAAAALFVVHPLGLMSLGVALGSVALLRALVERSAASTRSAAYVLLPWVLLGLGFLGWSWLVADRGDIVAPFLRRKFNVTDLPGGLMIGNYHLLLNPMVLAAVLLALPVWLVSPRHIGNQVMAGVVAGVMLVFFVPVISTPIANATAEEAVWRLHRLVPAGLVLAYALHYGLAKLSPTGLPVHLGRLTLGISPEWAASVAVLLVFGSALFIQEQYAVVDDGAYYNRTSPTELLPWTGGSIFLGGVERAFSSDWRPTAAEGDVLAYLRANAAPGSIVLVPPSISTRFFSGVLDDVRPVDYRGAPEPQERQAAVAAFYDGSLRGAELRSALERYGVDYVVVGSGSASEQSIQAVGGETVEALETLVAYDAEQFAAGQGVPDMAVRVGEGDEYPAWALDADEREELNGPTFTVPPGAGPGPWTLDLIVEVAPASDVTDGNGVVALVVSLDYVEDGEAYAGRATDTVIDLVLEAGSEGGDRVVRMGSALKAFSAGETYRVRVWREGGHDIDTYPDDLWFARVEIARPADDTEGRPKGYQIYQVEP